MQISLDNLWHEPDDPFYSYVIENYGDKALFNPIDVAMKISDNSINGVFYWIEWISWRIQKTNFDEWRDFIFEYINSNFIKCTDLEILYWLLLANPEIQLDENFKHYIKLYEEEYFEYEEEDIEIDLQTPFVLWIDLEKLHVNYWSNYFFQRKFNERNNTDYPNSLVVELIHRIKDKSIKNKWFKKFINNKPNSKDLLDLQIEDET